MTSNGSTGDQIGIILALKTMKYSYTKVIPLVFSLVSRNANGKSNYRLIRGGMDDCGLRLPQPAMCSSCHHDLRQGAYATAPAYPS